MKRKSYLTAHDWLQETQPDEWAKVEKKHGAKTLDVIAKRLAEVLDKEGTLHVLRKGFKHVNANFDMCAFASAQSFKATTLLRRVSLRPAKH